MKSYRKKCTSDLPVLLIALALLLLLGSCATKSWFTEGRVRLEKAALDMDSVEEWIEDLR